MLELGVGPDWRKKFGYMANLTKLERFRKSDTEQEVNIENRSSYQWASLFLLHNYFIAKVASYETLLDSTSYQSLL